VQFTFFFSLYTVNNKTNFNLLTIYFASFFAGRRELIILEEKNGGERIMIKRK